MKVLIVGGFDLTQSAWSIARGFERLGHGVIHRPSRGVVKERATSDRKYARGESRRYGPEVLASFDCDTVGEFCDRLLQTVSDERPRLLIWWTCKRDKPRGLIREIRERFPFCTTVFQTQDDPWNAERHPRFSEEFEYAITCCKASEATYEKRGIKAITLYPPPDRALHGQARPDSRERCDVSFTPANLYDGQKWKRYGMYVSRKDVIRAGREMGKFHLYGRKCPVEFKSCHRGWREFEELPQVHASSRIGLNTHLAPCAYGYLNKRAIEIPASGCFMLCDHVNGIEETFDVGKEIDTWRSLEELRDKAAWWLSHERGRKAAAQQAQHRLLKEHDNVAFATKLLDFTGAGR